MANPVKLPAGVFATTAPRLGQDTANAAEAQRVMQLQEAVGKMAKGPGAPTTGEAAVKIGQQMQQEAAAGQMKGMEVAGKQAQQVKALQDNQVRIEKARRIGDTKLAVSRTIRAQEDELAQLSASTKQILVDQQLEFKRDEFQRALFNERQLLDWAVTQAKSDAEFAEYEQLTLQAMERHEAVVNQAAKVIEMHMQQSFASSEQMQDQQLKQDLLTMKQAADLANQRAKNRKVSSASAWTAGGAVVGTVIGGVIGFFAGGVGSVPGAAVGASIGGGIGSALGSYMGAQE